VDVGFDHGIGLCDPGRLLKGDVNQNGIVGSADSLRIEADVQGCPNGLRSLYFERRKVL